MRQSRRARRAFTILESLVTLAALFVLTMLLLSLIKYHTSPKPGSESKRPGVPMENAKTKVEPLNIPISAPDSPP